MFQAVIACDRMGGFFMRRRIAIIPAMKQLRLFSLLSAISFVLFLLLLCYLVFSYFAHQQMYPRASTPELLSLAIKSRMTISAVPFEAWHFVALTAVLPLAWLIARRLRGRSMK